MQKHTQLALARTLVGTKWSIAVVTQVVNKTVLAVMTMKRFNAIPFLALVCQTAPTLQKEPVNCVIVQTFALNVLLDTLSSTNLAKIHVLQVTNRTRTASVSQQSQNAKLKDVMNVTMKASAKPAKGECIFIKDSVWKVALGTIEQTEFHGHAWKHQSSHGTGFILQKLPAELIVVLSKAVGTVLVAKIVSIMETAAKTWMTIVLNYYFGERKASERKQA